MSDEIEKKDDIDVVAFSNYIDAAPIENLGDLKDFLTKKLELVHTKMHSTKKDRDKINLDKALKYNPKRVKELKRAITKFYKTKKVIKTNFTLTGTLISAVEMEESYLEDKLFDEEDYPFEIDEVLAVEREIVNIECKPLILDVKAVEDLLIETMPLSEIDKEFSDSIESEYKELKKEIDSFDEEIQDLRLDVTLKRILETV